MTNNNKQTNVTRRNKVFSRITLIVILGVFVLLSLSMLLTTGIMTLLAQNWDINEDNIFLFGVIVLAISIIIGILLSVVYSAIVVRAMRPYIYGLQTIAECDFSVRIEDSPILSGIGVAEYFNNMARQLGSVETLREDFVSNFSHEFKTPIVSISGFATLLKNPNLTKEERDEYLDVIIDESARLVSLSESVLMLSRLDSQTLVNEKFLLDEQIRQSMLLFERSAATKKIEMTADLDKINLNSEKKLLSQVWVNLLSNAVKFTQKGGKIEVSAKAVDDCVKVSVSDSGCGMDEETLKNVFNKFFQGDRSHASEGNGLGLSVVKKICDLLGLGINIQSTVGLGSTFTVTIPSKYVVKQEVAAPQTQKRNIPHKVSIKKRAGKYSSKKQNAEQAEKVND